jgi:hypothetical protein
MVSLDAPKAWLGRVIKMTENQMKIRLLLDPTDWHRASAELVWVEVLWGGTRKIFKILNSPFYARGISYLDVVDVVPAPDGYGLDYARTIQKSGHSNIWLQVPSPPPKAFKYYWSSLHELGCTYESSSEDTKDGNKILYAVDVPPEAEIDQVLSILERGQDRDVWIFQIGHLAHNASNGAGH